MTPGKGGGCVLGGARVKGCRRRQGWCFGRQKGAIFCVFDMVERDKMWRGVRLARRGTRKRCHSFYGYIVTINTGMRGWGGKKEGEKGRFLRFWKV